MSQHSHEVVQPFRPGDKPELGGVRHHQTTGLGSCKVYKAVGDHAGDHGYDWFEDQRIRFAVDTPTEFTRDSEKFLSSPQCR